MPGETRIVSLEATPLDIELHEPFGIAGGALPIAANVLVRVELENGVIGYGEGAPLPAYNGETQASTLDAIERARKSTIGRDARARQDYARALGISIREAGAARCALETAALDAWLTTRGQSFESHFGGKGQALESDVTITTGTKERAGEAAARWEREGFRALKVKIGGVDLATDVERILAVRESAPSCRILADANASMTAKDAIELVKRLRARGVELALFEQPTAKDDWDGLEEVSKHVLVAADESIVTVADAERLAKLGRRAVVNIKLMKAGIAEALEIVEVANEAGVGHMIGGNVESVLAMSVSAAFAAGISGFDFIDLDTPLFMKSSPFEGGYRLRGPALEDAKRAGGGHGVRPIGAAARLT